MYLCIYVHIYIIFASVISLPVFANRTLDDALANIAKLLPIEILCNFERLMQITLEPSKRP